MTNTLRRRLVPMLLAALLAALVIALPAIAEGNTFTILTVEKEHTGSITQTADGFSVTMNAPEPHDPEGFEGWAIAPGGEMFYAPGDAISIMAFNPTVTLYAVYEPAGKYTYTIYYISKGNSRWDVYTSDSASCTAALSGAYVSGFSGYAYTENGEIVHQPGDEVTLTAETPTLTLYAVSGDDAPRFTYYVHYVMGDGATYTETLTSDQNPYVYFTFDGPSSGEAMSGVTGWSLSPGGGAAYGIGAQGLLQHAYPELTVYALYDETPEPAKEYGEIPEPEMDPVKEYDEIPEPETDPVSEGDGEPPAEDPPVFESYTFSTVTQPEENPPVFEAYTFSAVTPPEEEEPDADTINVRTGETVVSAPVETDPVFTAPEAPSDGLIAFESPLCPQCGNLLDTGIHDKRSSTSPYCDVQHYACTGLQHYCDPNGENPGCGDTYPCKSSNAHTPCRACGKLWCNRTDTPYGHTAPCGNDDHRPCILDDYNRGDHSDCGICYEPLCNGDRHGNGVGRCGYHEPEPEPAQPAVEEYPEEEYPEEDEEDEFEWEICGECGQHYSESNDHRECWEKYQ